MATIDNISQKSSSERFDKPIKKVWTLEDEERIVLTADWNGDASDEEIAFYDSIFGSF